MRQKVTESRSVRKRDQPPNKRHQQRTRAVSGSAGLLCLLTRSSSLRQIQICILNNRVLDASVTLAVKTGCQGCTCWPSNTHKHRHLPFTALHGVRTMPLAAADVCVGLLSAANISHKHSTTAPLISCYAAILDSRDTACSVSFQEITEFGIVFLLCQMEPEKVLK